MEVYGFGDMIIEMSIVLGFLLGGIAVSMVLMIAFVWALQKIDPKCR